MTRLRILIYEKNVLRSDALRKILESAGHEVRGAFYPDEAAAVTMAFDPQVVIAGLDAFPLPERMQGMKIMISAPQAEYREVERLSYLHGAKCVTYPYDAEPLLLAVEKVISSGEIAPHAVSDDPLPEIIGESPGVKKIKETLPVAAGVPSTVLILGETGTGKEVVAKALHRLGARKKGPFVAINCAAIPESLLEAELFGHEKGAFTGAVGRKPGKFEIASGGTLFLDEIGEIPPSVQVKFLRVLESGSFYRVGGETPVTVDTRVVCATNKDVFQMASRGTFRRDLLYRINVITLNLPPLRERIGDLPILANHFLSMFSKKYGKKAKRLSSGAMDTLDAHGWPGNIRELQNVLERAVIHSKGEEIPSVSLEGADSAEKTEAGPDMNRLLEMDFPSMKEKVLEHFEKLYIAGILSSTGGSIQSACQKSGMDRKTLYRKMKQYGMDKKDFK